MPPVPLESEPTRPEARSGAALDGYLDGVLSGPLKERLWRGDALKAPSASLPSGFAALDAQLPGGGWPMHCLTELLVPVPGIGEMRLVAPCLAQLARAKRQIIVMASAEARCGLLYPDGWAQLGIDPALILLIQTERLADRLWALEQSLKSAAFGALLAWLPETRPDALRRLQLAAAKASGLSFLVRSASAQMHSSPAPLRLLLGRAQHSLIEDRLLSVRIIKRRGPVLDEALLLKLSDPRPLRSRSLAHRLPARTPSVMSSSVLEHALGRPPLSDTAPRSHPTPAA